MRTAVSKLRTPSSLRSNREFAIGGTHTQPVYRWETHPPDALRALDPQRGAGFKLGQHHRTIGPEGQFGRSVAGRTLCKWQMGRYAPAKLGGCSALYPYSTVQIIELAN